MKFLALPFLLVISFGAQASSQIPRDLEGTFKLTGGAQENCLKQIEIQDESGDLRVIGFDADGLKDNRPRFDTVYKNINGKPVKEKLMGGPEFSHSETYKTTTKLNSSERGIHVEIKVELKYTENLRGRQGFDELIIPIILLDNLFGAPEKSSVTYDYDRASRILITDKCTYEKL